MALQSSGAISLNDMHVEVGGTSGTTCSLNDSDIRGLIGKASGATSSFSAFYGASAVSNWSSTMTVGTITVFKTAIYGYQRGAYTFGSLTDNTVDNLGGVEVSFLQYSGSTFTFGIKSTTQTNSGWTSITIGSQTINRTSLNFVNTNTLNNWVMWQGTVSTNPFGTTSGATRSISLT